MTSFHNVALAFSCATRTRYDRVSQHGPEMPGDMWMCARQPGLYKVLCRVPGGFDSPAVRDDLHRMARTRDQYIGKRCYPPLSWATTNSKIKKRAPVGVASMRRSSVGVAIMRHVKSRGCSNEAF